MIAVSERLKFMFLSFTDGRTKYKNKTEILKMQNKMQKIKRKNKIWDIQTNRHSSWLFACGIQLININILKLSKHVVVLVRNITSYVMRLECLLEESFFRVFFKNLPPACEILHI